MLDPIIQFKNLSFSYSDGKQILDCVSFDIFKGEFVSLIGHNGSGKSTIALLLIGLLEAKNGEIIIDSLPLNNEHIQEIRKKCALVFQNPDDQFIGATVEDDIAFGLENRQIKHQDMQQIVEYFANKVGMLSYLKKEPQNLSGGQKQRVSIAGALALKPSILILDEATSMLDPKGKKDILDLVLNMRKENKDLTIISITHDIDEALESDRVIALSNGKVVLNGDPKTVLKDEELLKKLSLDIPFIYSIQNKLRNNGIIFKEDYEDIDSLAEAICQLK